MIPRRWLGLWLIGSGWRLEEWVDQFHPIRSQGPTPGYTPITDFPGARRWTQARVYLEDRQ